MSPRNRILPARHAVLLQTHGREHARTQLARNNAEHQKRKLTDRIEQHEQKEGMLAATVPAIAKGLGLKSKRLFGKPYDAILSKQHAQMATVAAFSKSPAWSIGMQIERLRMLFEYVVAYGQRAGIILLMCGLAAFRQQHQNNKCVGCYSHQFDSTIQPISGHVSKTVGKIAIKVSTEVMVQSGKLTIMLVACDSDDFVCSEDRSRLQVQAHHHAIIGPFPIPHTPIPTISPHSHPY